MTTQQTRRSGDAPRPGLVELSISRRAFFARAGAALVGAAGAFGGKAKALAGSTLNRFGVRTPWYSRGEVVTTYGVCDMCPWRCGLVVHSVDGVVQKVDGNPLDPKSRGRLCARGQGGVSFTMDPDRLTTPLIRTGERGSGEFREAGWSEALDEAAGKIAAIRDEYGPESVAVFAHTASDFWFADYFAQAFGTPNAAKPSSSLCLSPRDEASTLTLGFTPGGHEPVDWDGLECLTLIGSHVGEDARNTLMQDFSTLRDRQGSTIIVVDPRLSSAATKADHWLPIRPGTDTALLLAWINVLITEELYDADYLHEWATGLDRLATHVAGMTPEWAASITDLDPESIRATARAMAASRPRSVIMPGRHTTWYGNDSQRMRAVYIVNSLLGAYGRQGGMYLNKSPYLEAYPHPPFLVAGSSGGCSAPSTEEVSDELPLGPTGKARADGARTKFLRGATALQELIDPMISGDPYPIKGLIVSGVNLLHSVPDTERTKQALAALDFVLVVDVLPQEHVAWADVVLPESTSLERTEDLSTMPHKTPIIQLREAAMEPLHDTKPAWWMVRELGLRLDMDPYFQWEDIDEWVDRRLISVASSMEKMRQGGGVIVQKGAPYLEDHDESPFATPTGKIELYSEALAQAGFDPLPVYEEIEQPEPGWYRLLYGRHPVHTFAKTQNTPILSGLYPENELWLNAAEASAAGIGDGDRVWLENQDGARSGPIKVKATQRIRPDSVFMVHGFGHASAGLTNAHGRGASDTKLQTRYRLDPISGGAGMRVNFVRIVQEV